MVFAGKWRWNGNRSNCRWKSIICRPCSRSLTKRGLGFLCLLFLTRVFKCHFFIHVYLMVHVWDVGFITASFSKPKCENLGNIQFFKTNTINQSEFSIQRAGKSARACRDVVTSSLNLCLLLVFKNVAWEFSANH